MKPHWNEGTGNRPSQNQLRNFGCAIGIIVPLILGWLIPTLAGHSFNSWTLLICVPALLSGFMAPNLLYYSHPAWISASHTLTWIETQFILGLVFIVVLQPIALVLRILGNDLLRSKMQRSVQSYRETCADDHVDLARIF